MSSSACGSNDFSANGTRSASFPPRAGRGEAIARAPGTAATSVQEASWSNVRRAIARSAHNPHLVADDGSDGKRTKAVGRANGQRHDRSFAGEPLAQAERLAVVGGNGHR